MVALEKGCWYIVSIGEISLHVSIALSTCLDCKNSKYRSHLRHNNIRLFRRDLKTLCTSSNQSEILACCFVMHVVILLLQWHPSNFFVLGQGPTSGSFAWGQQTPVDEAHRTRGWDGGPKFAKAVRVRNRHVLSESYPGVYLCPGKFCTIIIQQIRILLLTRSTDMSR